MNFSCVQVELRIRDTDYINFHVIAHLGSIAQGYKAKFHEMELSVGPSRSKILFFFFVSVEVERKP